MIDTIPEICFFPYLFCFNMDEVISEVTILAKPQTNECVLHSSIIFSFYGCGINRNLFNKYTTWISYSPPENYHGWSSLNLKTDFPQWLCCREDTHIFILLEKKKKKSLNLNYSFLYSCSPCSTSTNTSLIFQPAPQYCHSNPILWMLYLCCCQNLVVKPVLLIPSMVPIYL